jgi:alpha-galactosidase
MSSVQIGWREDQRTIVLEGPYWHIYFDRPLGLFNLSAPPFPGFQVRWARARVRYRRGFRRYDVGTDDGELRDWRVEPREDLRGNGLSLRLLFAGNRRPRLEFLATIYRNSPWLVLELAVHNVLAEPIALEALQPFEIDPQWGGRLWLGDEVTGLYCEGWQSWSAAGWCQVSGRERRSRNPLSAPMDDGVPSLIALSGCFRSDLVGVLTSRKGGPALLCGLLTSGDQFGHLEVRSRAGRIGLAFRCSTDGQHLGPGESVWSERVGLCLARPEERPLEQYAELLAAEMGGRGQGPSPTGWCSWTAFGRRVREEDVLRQVAWLAEQGWPVDVVQVDDGWEQEVGDWEPNERFPHGMAWLAEEIRRAGFRPGLWLAPFIVRPTARTAREHPEWLLRDARGRPVPAGVGSVNLCYGLDLTRSDVQEWLGGLVRRVVGEWGYRYLKLDFLYGGALPGVRKRSDISRAQALRRGLETIRAAAGDEVYLLGCGCPLGPAIGLVDGMRIGPDVAPNWEPRLGVLTPLVRLDPLFPAAGRAVHHTLVRSWTHGHLWRNDPDALLVRRAGSRLTEAEARTLLTVIALSGGSWTLGDDLPLLEDSRREWGLLGVPVHSGRPTVPDLLFRERPQSMVLEVEQPWGRGWVVALLNPTERPAELRFPLSALGLEKVACHLHEFWSGEYRLVQGWAVFPNVEPHGCRTFLLRVVDGGLQWVGSTLHIVQGEEVASWEQRPDGVHIALRDGRWWKGAFLLAVPEGAALELRPAAGARAELETVIPGIWRVRVEALCAGALELWLEVRHEGAGRSQARG